MPMDHYIQVLTFKTRTYKFVDKCTRLVECGELNFESTRHSGDNSQNPCAHYNISLAQKDAPLLKKGLLNHSQTNGMCYGIS